MIKPIAVILLLLTSSHAAIAQTAPRPTAPCMKRFADPVPLGQGQWIGPDDYPQRLLRAEIGGKVRFRVNVSVLGRAESVQILASDLPELAAATEMVLKRRARFSPAVRDCVRVPGEYEGSLTWSIPE